MGDLGIPEEVEEALKEVRDDKAEVNYTVVGYDDSQPKTLALFGKGNEGIEGLASSVKQGDVAYCLLRIDFTYEAVGNIKSDTTRFLFIYYRPESLPLKRKMMIGSVEGKVKKLFAPYMRSVEIDSTDKLTADWVQDLIDSVTMTKDKTTDKKAEEGIFITGNFVKARNDATDKKNAGMSHDTRTNFSYTEGAVVKFVDELDLVEKVKAVRADDNASQWCMFSYVDKKTIGFEAAGEGNIEEMVDALPDDKICYGLFRLVENYNTGRNDKGEKTVKIDQVKFGFFTYVPETGISPMLKAVISTHKGAVVSKFRPFHHQFYVQTKAELAMEKVMDTFAKISGVKSNVTDRKVEKKEEKYERKFVGGATKDVQTLKFQNKEDFDAGVAQVRSDSSEVIFALAEFVGDKKDLQLNFVTNGTTVDEMVGALKENSIQYGIVRNTQQVDGYDTTKFNLFRYEGSEVSITVKGAVGVFHGAVTEAFGQAHSFEAFRSREEVSAKFSI